MITLHRCPGDPAASRIEEKLQDLVVAYHTIEYDKKSRPHNAEELPYISENDHIVTGKKQIESYLTQLALELNQQRQLTGDGCYIDPETGEVC